MWIKSLNRQISYPLDSGGSMIHHTNRMINLDLVESIDPYQMEGYNRLYCISFKFSKHTEEWQFKGYPDWDIEMKKILELIGINND